MSECRSAGCEVGFASTLAISAHISACILAYISAYISVYISAHISASLLRECGERVVIKVVRRLIESDQVRL